MTSKISCCQAGPPHVLKVVLANWASPANQASPTHVIRPLKPVDHKFIDFAGGLSTEVIHVIVM